MLGKYSDPTTPVTQGCLCWYRKKLAGFEAQLKLVQAEMIQAREHVSARIHEEESRPLYEKEVQLQNKICSIKKVINDFYPIRLENLAITGPVGIGSVITLLFCGGRDGEVNYLIDGASWEPEEGLMVVSACAPLAQAVIGKNIDDEIFYEIAGKKQVAQIMDCWPYVCSLEEQAV